MSQGTFTTALYTDDANIVRPIRVQPETLTFTVAGTANTGPVGPGTAGATRARVSGGKRSYGVVARKVYFKFTGTPPTGYKADSTLAIPVLQPAAYAIYKDAARTQSAGTYAVGGATAAIKVVGVSAEGGRG